MEELNNDAISHDNYSSHDDDNSTSSDVVQQDSNSTLLPSSPDKTFYCFRRLFRELLCCQPWFRPIEPVNQRELNIPVSFAPYTCTAVLTKCVFSGIATGTFVYAFFSTDHPEFIMAFYTMWANLCCVLYLGMSTLNTMFYGEETTTREAVVVPLRIRITWVLFELAVHLSTMASAGYYAFIVDWDNFFQRFAYLDVAVHGGVLVLVVLDGFVINRIPFRFQHYFGIILPVEILYCVWYSIHSITDIGNPMTGDPDGGIYGPGLDWSTDWERALIAAAFRVFVIGPIGFLGLWSVGNGLLCCRDLRRYKDQEAENEEKGWKPTVAHGDE